MYEPVSLVQWYGAQVSGQIQVPIRFGSPGHHLVTLPLSSLGENKMGLHLRGEGGGLGGRGGGGGGEWVLIARHTVFLCPPHSPCSLGDFLSCLYPSGDDPTLNKPKKKNSRGLFERVGCVALCWAQC